MKREDRHRLQAALTAAYRWLDEPEWGPRSVVAGECDRCELAPRLVPTCGPVAWVALCRDCTLEVGREAWCDGHAAEGEDILEAVRNLPAEWRSATILWWVATGEVQLDRGSVPDVSGLPRPVLASLDRASG